MDFINPSFLVVCYLSYMFCIAWALDLALDLTLDLTWGASGLRSQVYGKGMNVTADTKKMFDLQTQTKTHHKMKLTSAS